MSATNTKARNVGTVKTDNVERAVEPKAGKGHDEQSKRTLYDTWIGVLSTSKDKIGWKEYADLVESADVLSEAGITPQIAFEADMDTDEFFEDMPAETFSDWHTLSTSLFNVQNLIEVNI